MNSPQNTPDSAIRRLTIAVWILVALVLINICVSLFAALFPPAIAKRLAVAMPEAFSPDFTPFQDDYAGFSDWPLEKQIAEASVIAVAKYEKDGDRVKAIITEILKKEPDVQFYYDVGDEYVNGGFYPREGTRYGDGQIIFFTGSPASMKYSCSFFGDRIAAFGDMPFDALQRLINQE